MIYKSIIISRSAYSQNLYGDFYNIQILPFLYIITDYDLLERMDKKTENHLISKEIKNQYGFELKTLFKFLSLLSENKELLLREANFAKKLESSQEELRKIFLNFSFKESDLREKWYEPKILQEPCSYQLYVSPPKEPFIYLDQSSSKIGDPFLRLSLPSSIKNIRKTVFTHLHKITSNFGEILGKALEEHIFEGLQMIFSNQEVVKFDNIPDIKNSQKADFYIELEHIIIIIEVKLSILSYKMAATLKPNEIPKMWNKLYGALVEQCGDSREYLDRKYQKEKLKVPLVIIGDDISTEVISFAALYRTTTISQDFDLSCSIICSWTTFMDRLSKISIKDFERLILDEHEKGNRLIMLRDLDLKYSSEKPAHSYEHIKKIKESLWNEKLC